VSLRSGARRACAGLLAASCLGSTPAVAQQSLEQWTFALTPYLFLPNINGTLSYDPAPAGGSPSVNTGPNNYLQNLSAALMLSGEARKGKWSILSDMVYLHFADEDSSVRSVDFGGALVGSTVSGSTRSTFTALEWTLAGAYNAVQTPRVTLDVLGGARYFGVQATSEWRLSAAIVGPGGGQTFPAAGKIDKQVDIVDAIIGIRGRVHIGEGRWFAPYYLDVGTGSSSLTWQGMAGVGYGFKWGDALLAYRHLYYDQSEGRLLQNISFSGPTLGAAFRF
jgi:hypothetical protein